MPPGVQAAEASIAKVPSHLYRLIAFAYSCSGRAPRMIEVTKPVDRGDSFADSATWTSAASAGPHITQCLYH